jgi:hypothetical protein
LPLASNPTHPKAPTDGSQTSDHLLAIVNPLAIVPFFIHYTQGFSQEQRLRTIRTAAFSAFCVIAACALLGLQILEFFNISLQSFQVGGGMLLLISAMNMLNAQPAEAKPNTHDLEEGAEKAAAGSSIAVVPLTIPAAHRPGQHVHRGDLRRPRTDLLAARRAGGLRRGDCRWPRRCASRWPNRLRACWARPAST